MRLHGHFLMQFIGAIRNPCFVVELLITSLVKKWWCRCKDIPTANCINDCKYTLISRNSVTIYSKCTNLQIGSKLYGLKLAVVL